jgi:hypothetical protein
MKVHTLGIEPAKNVFQLHGFHRDELQILVMPGFGNTSRNFRHR